MVYRFRSFELDEEKRELRLDDREVPIQPLVFELLRYLIHNRDRVVGKQELLRALWPSTVVTDASVQRAASLARSALREGASADVIRTHARQGYRFCCEVECLDASDSSDLPPETESPRLCADLEAASTAFERGEWQLAATLFGKADSADGLAGEDLERWSYALQCAGGQIEAVRPLERCVAARAMSGDRRGAARAALALARIEFEQQHAAVAAGWRRRAAKFLAGEEVSSEHGHLEWNESRAALVEGRLDDALEHAKRAHELGKSLADSDLEVLGLLYQGVACLAIGGSEVERGVALLDEAAAATLAGEVGTLAGGLVYCGVIWSCRNRCDWDRAAQWTEHFTRWCTRNRVGAYPGTCRLHRAEVLCVSGRLEEAERELTDASEDLSKTAPWAEGDAHRVLGDLLLARGELDRAEEAYGRAYALGWDPQPGWAVLHAERGRKREAIRELERSLRDAAWSSRQRRGLLLAHMVIVATAAGDTGRADEALSELDAAPELSSTSALAALAARARSDVALEKDAGEEAIRLLRLALRLWQSCGSFVHVAAARLRLARLLHARGERETAERELALAESFYAETRASRMVARCQGLRSSWDAAPGTTPRR